jgi:RNA polymerase sigma-70 factor (ECF subfamily)
MMTSRMSRSSENWLADLRDDVAQAEALADLRDYLLRAVFLYLDRHRDDLSHLDRRELEHLAEDCVQEALLQILDNLDTFRGESKFTTWAYRFVINVAAGELRLHRWRTLSMEALVSEKATLFTFLSDQQAPDPETMTSRKQILELLQQIIDEDLTERQRFALVNIYFRGVPVTEVAWQLDSTPNNVYRLVYDARKKLKRGLEQRHYSEADVLVIFGARQESVW